MSVLLFLFFLFSVNSQYTTRRKISRSPRLQFALDCDTNCKQEMHTCLDDVADECMRSCARGLSLESTNASVCAGDWFDCYHSCISSAGIRCFLKGGECLTECKEDTQVASRFSFPSLPEQSQTPQLPPPAVQTQQTVVPSEQPSQTQETVPAFMKRNSFDPDFSNPEWYSAMSGHLLPDFGSAQLYHNIKVEVDRRTKNYFSGNPSPLSSDWNMIY